jgi:hypothetical protein
MDTKNTAAIHLTGDFNASEIEDMIVTLANIRASLKPSVPMQLPPVLSEATHSVQESTVFKIRKRVDGGIRIWLRNEGLGWFCFELSATGARKLCDFIAKNVAGPPNSH